MSISSPTNSFYQFNSTAVIATPSVPSFCSPKIDIDDCIPIYNLNDIAFQYFIDAPPISIGELYIGVVDEDGNNVVRTSSIIWATPTYQEAVDSSVYIGTIVFGGIANDIRTKIGVNKCFRLRLFSDDDSISILSSYCFKVISDTCYTTQVKYNCNENSLGFNYEVTGFYNIVRLPFYCSYPKIKSKRTQYRKSDGDYIKLSSIMEEELQCKTEFMPADWHRCLAVSLEHDTVLLDGEKKIMNDDYDTNWDLDEPDYPNAPASFKVISSPFANSNSNC